MSSRSSAAAWGCHVHNVVNESLKKKLFDCSNIGDFYDCGCADGEETGKKESKEALRSGEKPEMDAESKERLTGPAGRDINEDLVP